MRPLSAVNRIKGSRLKGTGLLQLISTCLRAHSTLMIILLQGKRWPRMWCRHFWILAISSRDFRIAAELHWLAPNRGNVAEKYIILLVRSTSIGNVKMSFNIFFGLYLAFIASAHVFMGNPAPLQWNIEIDKLVMPMNGDPNHLGPAWGQQLFPCKGHHHNISHVPPQTTWHTGTNVTFQ